MAVFYTGRGSGGVKLPALTNPASASEIGEGYDAINAAGERMVGTGELAVNLAPELTTQDTLIADIMTALEGKSAASGGSADETVHITLKLNHGPTWNIAYSHVEDGKVVNRTYSGTGDTDMRNHFSLSGTTVYGELDIPKGSFIAIGHESGPNATLSVKENVNCFYSWLETIGYTVATIHTITDGATAYVEM